MTWLYSFAGTEFFFVGAFVALYSLYVWRTFRVARQLNTSAWGVIPKFFLRGIYFSLLLISLLGPSFGEAESDLVSTGHDTFLILDISRSMDANDIVPTRLERVKYDIQHLCDTLSAYRFGIVLAANEPFVLSPLTADQQALKQFIQDVHTSVSKGGGADLCSSIELARQKLVLDQTTRRSAKAIVVFSDGENAGPCDRKALLQLRSLGIPLITVGVGTELGASIRAGHDFVRDHDGQIVRSRLNRIFLQELAQDGRGHYFEADNNGQYINDLARSLRGLKSVSMDQHRVALATNKYYYFLLAALVFIALDLIVTIRTFRL